MSVWWSRLPAATLLVLILTAGVAGAQTIDTDEGSLFGSSDEQEESGEESPIDTSDLFGGEVLVTEPEAAGGPAVLPPAAVEIGGSYRFSLTGDVAWSSFEDLAGAPLEPDSQGVTVDLGATVFLDARPADDFRVFGKVDLSYPFTTDEDSQPPRGFDDIVSVRELFSDFTLGDVLFLRGGKHTIAWGVGYFFSPADVLNLTSIDPDDPGSRARGAGVAARQPADRLSQPLSLRDRRPRRRWRAARRRAQGGVRRGRHRDRHRRIPSCRPGAARHAHGEHQPAGLRPVRRAGWPAWARNAASWSAADRGPDTPHGLRAVRNTDDPFAAATGGLRYTYRPEEGDWSATFAGQYLWNGEGYEDAAVLRDNRRGVMKLLEAGDLSFGDLLYPGRHYAAASASVALGRRADWSMGAFWLSNLSDGSARVSPSVTFRPADQLTLRAAASVTYGEDGAEMTPFGSRVGASLTATLGSGRF